MMAVTHLAFALLLGLFFYPFFTGNPYIFLIIVLFSSLVPDLDQPNSRLGKKASIFPSLFKFAFGHRTLFHSILFGSLMMLLIYLFNEVYAWAFFIGFLSHLLTDGVTVSGVRIFYPVSNFKIKGFLRTNGFMELLLLLVFVTLIVLKFV